MLLRILVLWLLLVDGMLGIGPGGLLQKGFLGGCAENI
jgi:hypothetical protein